MPAPQKTHNVFTTYLEFANGRLGEPVEHRLHVSRNCGNCVSNGRNDPEWVAGGCIEKWGACINGCGAIESPDVRDQYCSEHVTPAEFEAGIHNIARPVLVLLKGGAA